MAICKVPYHLVFVMDSCSYFFFAFKVLIVFQSQRKKLIENFQWLFEKVHLTNSTFRFFDKKVPDLNFHFF